MFAISCFSDPDAMTYSARTDWYRSVNAHRKIGYQGGQTVRAEWRAICVNPRTLVFSILACTAPAGARDDRPDSRYIARRPRKRSGDIPFQRLNAREKLAVSAKPRASATASTDMRVLS